MKKYLVLLACLSVMAAFTAFGQCISVQFLHSTVGVVQFSNHTNGEAIAGTFWNWDSDTDGVYGYETAVPITDWYWDLSTTSGYIYGDWGNYGVGSGVGACADINDAMTVSLAWDYNEASTNHYAEYVVAAVDYNLSANNTWDYDDVNGGTQTAATWPYVTDLANVVYDGVGNVTADITWSAASGGQYENAAAIASANDLIEGYQIFYTESGSIPTTGDMSGGGWIAATDTADADTYFPGQATTSGNIQFPEPALGNHIYFAVGMIFSDNAGTIADSPYMEWVGENSFAGPNSSGAMISGGVRVANSSAAEVTSFEAAPGPGGISLTWETATETEFAGFNIYKSTDGENFTKINDGMINATGSAGGGSNYSFVDSSRTKRPDLSRKSRSSMRSRTRNISKSVYYKLELVNQDGSSRFVSKAEFDMGNLAITR